MSRSKVSPHNTDAEMACIGSAIRDKDHARTVLEMLTYDSFYAEKHRIIFQAIENLYSKNEVIDLTTVSSELNSRLKSIGGRVYLAELVEGAMVVSNPSYHAKIVKKDHTLRRIIKKSEDTINSCYDTDTPLDAILNEAEKGIFELSLGTAESGFTKIGEHYGDVLEQVQEYQIGEAQKKIVHSGFADLDEVTQGFKGGELIYLAGRPSHGKSILAEQIGEYTAKQGKPVGFWTFEMSKFILAERSLFTNAKIDSTLGRKQNGLKDGDFDKLTNISNNNFGIPFYIDDKKVPAIELKSKARRSVLELGLKLIVVDYLQLMALGQNAENRNIEVGNISKIFKELAIELNIPFIVLSQLSRIGQQGEKPRRPRLSDLRESGSLEQDADQVIFVHRSRLDEDYGDGKVGSKQGIIVAKNRNGKLGEVPMSFIDGHWDSLSFRKEY